MRPLLILAEGQSNCMARLPYAWTPPTNLYIWDFDGQVDPATKVGTQFFPASGYSGVMGSVISFAAEMAFDNPSRDIYLVNVAIGGQAIAHWLTGTSSPDMYAASKANIEAAIPLISSDYELLHYWWQGENDAGVNTNYPGDFWAHIARKRTETWWPVTTPTVVMAISPYVSAALTNFNRKIVEAASLDPSRLIFVDTTGLGQYLWDPLNGTPYVHMYAEGYRQAGKMAFNAIRYGLGSTVSKGSFNNPATGHQLRPNVPAFKASKSTASSVGIVTGFNTPSGIDTGNCFDDANGAFVAPDDGLYMLGFNFANPAVDQPLVMCLAKNGTDITGTYVTATKAYESVSASTIVYMARGEYVQVKVSQGPTGASAAASSFWGYFVG